MGKGVVMSVICLLAISFFIASCVPVSEYYICKDGTRVRNAEECYTPMAPEPKEEVKQPEPAPEPAPEPVVKEISPAAQVYFDNNAKVTSLQYSYVESPQSLPEDIYYTTKDKMKIELKVRAVYAGNEYYDTVYLDLVKNTATAYCEYRDRSVCKDRDKAYSVDFDKYFRPTPWDWIDRITKADLTGKSKIFASRNAVEMNIEVDGLSGTMFVDSFFGIPLQITYLSKNYEFRDIVMNEVKSTQLEHQFSQ
ncbi:hypothetical protein JXB28_02955 [Candidatus Woesearchaeota archaeon]|nr:hypothetical protein [Candidatus Woesearchaeota archaeon]